MYHHVVFHRMVCPIANLSNALIAVIELYRQFSNDDCTELILCSIKKERVTRWMIKSIKYHIGPETDAYIAQKSKCMTSAPCSIHKNERVTRFSFNIVFQYRMILLSLVLFVIFLILSYTNTNNNSNTLGQK